MKKFDTPRFGAGLDALLDPEGDNVAILVTTVTVLRPTVH